MEKLELGSCTLYNGDCLEVMQRLIDDGVKVDCIITDPPYKMTSRGGIGNTGGMLKKQIVNSGNVFANNDCHVSKWAALCYEILREGSHAYFMTNNINLTEYLNELQRVGFHFIKCLIWDKQKKIMGTAYMGQFEYVIFVRKGAFKKVNNCGISDILSIPIKKLKDSIGDNLHDTEKPVALYKLLIEQSTNEGDIVLDPFSGIGANALGCGISNRKAYCIELDKGYYDIACERIEKTLIENESKLF